MEHKDGVEVNEVFVLSGSSLTMLELKSLQRWSVEDQMVYRCGLHVAPASLPLADEMLRDLVRTRASDEGVRPEYVVLPSDELRESKLALLLHFEHHGLVEQIEMGRDAWRYTNAGMLQLQTLHVMRNQGMALQCRQGVARHDFSVLELLHSLDKDGWKGRVFVRTPGEAKEPAPHPAVSNYKLQFVNCKL